MNLSQLSVQSRLLTPLWEDKDLGSATGFVVTYQEAPYLITNWHVVTGRNPITGEILSTRGVVPDALLVRHFMTPVDKPGPSLEWQDFKEDLYAKEGEPLWLEHPMHGHGVDVVALPLTNYGSAQLLPYVVGREGVAVQIRVSEWVSIIGFPFGPAASASIAIWTKGSIASEPEIDFNDLPCFLIDARTRQGQSGSPVIYYSNGGTVPLMNGSMGMIPGVVSQLLGVYSGRINPESDIGRVWKVRVVEEILAAGQRGRV